MGQLLYGTPPDVFDIDDRTLAHLEIVILAKLRRNESFALVLDYPTGNRTMLWFNPHLPLQIRLESTQHEVNRAWLDVLIDSANSPAGLRVTPEPE